LRNEIINYLFKLKTPLGEKEFIERKRKINKRKGRPSSLKKTKKKKN
jgi:hypothetical protein